MGIVSDVEIRLRADIARLHQDLTSARRSFGNFTGDVKKMLGGMLAATCIAIFIIPVTFYVVEKRSRKGDAGVASHAGTADKVNGKNNVSGKTGDGHA